MILLVMYELKSPGDSSSVYETVATFGPASHVLDSFCLVATEKTPTELRNELRTRLNGSKDVFVTQLTQKHADYLPKPALDWIAKQNGGKQGLNAAVDNARVRPEASAAGPFTIKRTGQAAARGKADPDETNLKIGGCEA
jgi:hypothetical protein